MNLQRGIAARSGEFLLFAVTPPRLTTSPQEAAEIARVTLERLRPLAIDGLVLYDIDDESDRNPDERPFPFLPTMDPADYLARDLARLEVPAIVYRAVGKYREDRFRSWLEEQDPSRALTVFVGSSSREKAVLTSLARAYELRDEVQPELPLGGVAIAERHARQGDEHLRLIAKQAAGCSFFITQIVYDVNAAKNLISDYHHECAAQNLEPVPIVFSFSVCGSLKTLEFLQWLGVTVAFTGDLMVELGKSLAKIPSKMGALVDAIGGGERDKETPISVVGASIIGGETVDHGLWVMFWFFTCTDSSSAR